MAGQKQVIKIDDSDSEWEEMPVWLLPQEEILPELLPEQSLPVLLPEQILPVLLQEEIPSALLPEQTLVIPVDGMDQTKFRMPSPKWFKGKPAKEVRYAEETASRHTSESEATAIVAMSFLCNECGRSLGEVVMGDPRMCDWAGAPYCDVCWIRWEIDQMVQSLRCISHGSSLGALISDSVIADGIAMHLVSKCWEWDEWDQRWNRLPG